MNRRIGRAVGIGMAAGLACLACCVVELGLVGGLSALTIGVEASEVARFTPLLILAVVSVAAVAVLRHRRRRTRPTGPVQLGMPQRRPEVSAPHPTHEARTISDL